MLTGSLGLSNCPHCVPQETVRGTAGSAQAPAQSITYDPQEEDTFSKSRQMPAICLGLPPNVLWSRFSHRPLIHRLHQYPQRELQDFRNLGSELFEFSERIGLSKSSSCRGVTPTGVGSMQRYHWQAIVSRMGIGQLRNRQEAGGSSY